MPFAVLYSGSEDVFGSWITLLTSPCPLITDYFMLGSLPAAFFNAGICGLVCALLLLISDGDYTCFEWAGFTDAVICTTTSTAHGGFTAGLTALILNPVLGFYSKKKH